MKSHEEIFRHVVGLMSRMFELDSGSLHENSLLFSELDIDSIDAVDLIVELTAYTGKRIPPESFKSVRTIGDIVTAIEELIKND